MNEKWRSTTKALVFRTDDEQYEELEKYAKRNNTSKSEALRTFVEWGLEAAQIRLRQ
jgi:hypothetical protein